MNIAVKTTAAYSPWSNGKVERHNQVLTQTYIKLCCENANFSQQLALDHASFAKNCLLNSSGFSAFQFVFGFTPMLPSIISDNLPTLCSSSDLSVYANGVLNTLQKARGVFTSRIVVTGQTCSNEESTGNQRSYQCRR